MRSYNICSGGYQVKDHRETWAENNQRDEFSKSIERCGCLNSKCQNESNVEQIKCRLTDIH